MSRWKPGRPTVAHSPKAAGLWRSRRLLLLVAWLGVITFAVIPGAYPDDRGTPDDGYELPPATDWGGPQGPWSGDGSVGASQRTLTRRAKVIIRLPNLFGWAIVNPVDRRDRGGRGWAPMPMPDRFGPAVPGCELTIIGGDTTLTSVYAIGQHGRPVGELPPVTINTVAFGSIPVSATLVLSQRIDGELVPLHADLWTPQGIQTPANCDPDYFTKNPRGFGVVEGPLSLTISALRIDGRPVDVGRRCRAVAPLDINLWAADAGSSASDDPWFPTTGGRLYQREDTTRVDVPGGRLLHPGSTDLTIPAFAGCRSTKGDDISRLLTATISGPGNEIAVRQTAIRFSGTPGYWYGKDIGGGAVQDPPPPPDIPVPTD